MVKLNIVFAFLIAPPNKLADEIWTSPGNLMERKWKKSIVIDKYKHEYRKLNHGPYRKDYNVVVECIRYRLDCQESGVLDIKVTHGVIEGSQKRFLDLVTASVDNLTHTVLLYWMCASSLILTSNKQQHRS